MKWVIVVVIILVILLLAFFGFCAYAGHFLINAFLLRDSTWYENQGHRMLNPDNYQRPKNIYTETEDRQNQLGHRFWDEQAAGSRQLELDGEKLVAREFHPAAKSHRWMLCIHGYRSTGKRDMSYPALKFVQAGANVLVPDLRAHGHSTGKKISMGWFEKRDVEAWVQEIIKLDPQAQIILFGGSMGAASVLMASGDHLPKQVKLIIADCGYSSVYAECRYLLKSAMHLPTGPILFFANQFCQHRLGFSLKMASSVKQLHHNQLPLLLIHGTADKFVPHQALYKNMEATQGPVQAMLIQKAPHLSSWIYDESRYFTVVQQFIDNNLERGNQNG